MLDGKGSNTEESQDQAQVADEASIFHLTHPTHASGSSKLKPQCSDVNSGLSASADWFGCAGLIAKDA